MPHSNQTVWLIYEREGYTARETALDKMYLQLHVHFLHILLKPALYFQLLIGTTLSTNI